MAETYQKVNFFTPLKWEQGKHPKERLHWLGRIVEPYFDVGQQSFVVHKPLSKQKTIPCYRNVQKLSLVSTILKCSLIALKILTYFTVLLPAVFLVAKGVYRLCNPFVYQDKLNPDEPVRIIKNICDRYNPEHKSSSYKRMATKIDELAVSDFSDKETINSIVTTYLEIKAAQDELSSLKSKFNGTLPKDMSDMAANAAKDLKELMDKFVALISKEQQESLEDALKVSYEEARADLKKYIDDLETWNVTQTEILQNLEQKDWGAKFKDLVIRSQGMINYQLKSFPSFQRYLKNYSFCQQFFPRLKERKKYETFKLATEALLEPKGVPNFGNTCYLSAILQGIASEPSFIKQLNTNISNNEDANEIIHALKIFVSAQRSKNYQAIRFATQGVCQILQEKGIVKDAYEQNDASEVLQLIMMRIQYPTFVSTIEREYSLSNRNGTLISKDPLNTLALTVKASDMVESDNLQGLIDRNFTKKQMDGQLSIGKGMSVEGWQEKVVFESIPDSLIITLKRFETNKGKPCKIGQHVELPKGGIVDLSSAYREGAIPKGKSALYEIYSVIKHHGAYGSGHYTASVKNGESWVRCDDGQVTKNDSSVDNEGYIYFLRRIS